MMRRLLYLLFLSVLIPIFGDVGQVISETKYAMSDAEETRVYHDIVLDCGKNGRANFTVSLPEDVPTEGLPCIVIVGGLMTGKESLRFVPNHGKYALVAYEYSDTLKEMHKVSALWHMFSVRNAVIDVAPQVVEVVKYLRKQHWYSGRMSISIMAYSFGAVFTPATYVHAQNSDIPLGPGVLAYGGAGAYCLFKANLPGPAWIREPLARLAAALFKPMDPIIFAPQMKGNFLIINGARDAQIPNTCAETLQDLIPPPKTVITLETDHMHPDNTELTLRLIKISRGWIEEQ